MEFLGGPPSMAHCHCGLCGNHGIVDTVGKVFTPAGHECGVKTFCICPNGRVMKRNAERAAKKAAKAPVVASKTVELVFPTATHDCGCSMCGGTHVVVNCGGHQRACDYCDCNP